MHGGTTKGVEIGSAHLGTPAGVRKRPAGRPVRGRGIGARLRRLVAGGAVVAGMVGLFAVPAFAREATDATRDQVALRASFALTALQREATATTSDESDAAALRYRDLRKELAVAVSDRAHVTLDDLDAAWARSDDRRMTVVLTALSQVGVPYSFGSSDPGVAFDCSGLTSWAWGNAGIPLEHSSYDQLAAADSRDHMVAMAGDLTGLARRGHVAIYLGIEDLVVHAPNTGSLVRVDDLSGRLAWFAYPAQ